MMMMVNEVKIERVCVRGDVDIADFAAMGFIGLDMDSTVGIPEAYGTVFAATQAIIAVSVEPHTQYGTVVTLQHVCLLLRKIFYAHLLFSNENPISNDNTFSFCFLQLKLGLGQFQPI